MTPHRRLDDFDIENITLTATEQAFADPADTLRLCDEVKRLKKDNDHLKEMYGELLRAAVAIKMLDERANKLSRSRKVNPHARDALIEDMRMAIDYLKTAIKEHAEESK